LSFFDELNITLDSLKEKLGSEVASDIKHLVELIVNESINPDKKRWFPECSALMCCSCNLRREPVWVHPVGANFEENGKGTIRYKKED